MTNRFVFVNDFDWPYNFVSIADQTQKFLRYDRAVLFSTTTGHVDSAHDDGATVTYRSYIIKEFSINGQVDYYTSLSKAIGVYYVDVCCFVAHTAFTGFGSTPINTNELPIYSRSNDIVVYERYKTTRTSIGQTPLVSGGYTDIVCDCLHFNLKTRKRIVLNPNDSIYFFCAVYTNKQYANGGEQLKVTNTVVDIRYDVN